MAPIRSAAALLPGTVGVNLACSGARTVDLRTGADGGEWLRGEPPQGDLLAGAARQHEVRLVVVTAGANDVGFGGLVADCALDWARSDEADPRYCRGQAQAEVAAALPAMRRGLVRDLRGVRATMAAAGYRRRDYRLVVMGYASPFPVGARIRYPESGWSRLRWGGCPLWNRDADWAALRATPEIDAAMRAVAGEVGGSARSASARAGRANRCTPTPSASVRSAPASRSSTGARRATTPARTVPAGATARKTCGWSRLASFHGLRSWS
jgi:hypothetical protein